MAALPDNWEWDYDGNRWFYRYKPTGLIQFTFPKPGDEFPEFVDDTAAPLDLAPEDRLVSQQQVRRRSTLDKSSKPADTSKRKGRASASALPEQYEDGSSFWFQPDGLMYMGPGAYTDISPLQEEEEEREQGGGKENTVPGTPASILETIASTHPTTTTTATDLSANQDLALVSRSQISPAVSAGTTPHVFESQLATTTPELDGAVVVVSSDNIPVDSAAVPPPDIPFLDGRELPYNPANVAELASEWTPQCHDELNPAPVELPSNEMMVDTSETMPYFNAFDMAPVELPSDAAPARRPAMSNVVEQKSLALPALGQKQASGQQPKAHQAVQEVLNRPYKPLRQNSMPMAATTSAKTPDAVGEGKYQPYNPAKHAMLGAAATNRASTANTPDLATAGDNKRRSLANPALPHFHSNIPAALQPAVVPRQLLDAARNGGKTTPPSQNPGGFSYFPSVLQPARGRPAIRAQSPAESQRASPARTYEAYQPYRNLQKDIEDTVQLLSQTAYVTAYGERTGQFAEPGIATRRVPLQFRDIPSLFHLQTQICRRL
ncbi:tRNA (adenine-N(1)-)-methyltransferase catalytic subunit trm61 [Collariella sp. IMI 366227]|nr:tRNA (adenine-N(1)-)-methyltransferase catalytic subunit trm61 [Collariella sp. IMI 366227]